MCCCCCTLQWFLYSERWVCLLASCFSALIRELVLNMANVPKVEHGILGVKKAHFQNNISFLCICWNSFQSLWKPNPLSPISPRASLWCLSFVVMVTKAKCLFVAMLKREKCHCGGFEAERKESRLGKWQLLACEGGHFPCAPCVPMCWKWSFAQGRRLCGHSNISTEYQSSVFPKFCASSLLSDYIWKSKMTWSWQVWKHLYMGYKESTAKASKLYL